MTKIVIGGRYYDTKRNCKVKIMKKHIAHNVHGEHSLGRWVEEYKSAKGKGQYYKAIAQDLLRLH